MIAMLVAEFPDAANEAEKPVTIMEETNIVVLF